MSVQHERDVARSREACIDTGCHMSCQGGDKSRYNGARVRQAPPT